jgi:hypothetical protein
MSSSEERKILDDYNKKHYANKTEFITGFIFKVLWWALRVGRSGLA